jgi:molybdate transport system ATP-binding protein
MLMEMRALRVSRPGQPPTLTIPNWTWKRSECWAVVGGNGAGKTTFGELLAGRLRHQGHFENLLTQPNETLSDVVVFVGFQEASRLFNANDHYYQERFHFSDPLQEITVESYLRHGLSVGEETFQNVLNRLKLDPLLPQSFITLSNGQTRRVRIARGVLRQPKVLILDDPHLGLDPAARLDLNAWLRELRDLGTELILLCREDFVPDFVTHILDLSTGITREHRPQPPLTPASRTWSSQSHGSTSAVVELENVRVAYGPKVILNNIHWTVRVGERWGLWGGNGSGKTTLLSLITGDHPQAYANRIRLFGQPRGSGESIWEIKRRIGLLSPELHLFFHEPLTAWQTAATGFQDVMAYSPPTPAEAARLTELFHEFRLTDLKSRHFRTLSTGQQRLVLFVRAIAKQPELLILDEPFQSLDRPTIEHSKRWLDTKLTPTQTLILVSHHSDELPDTLTHQLRL